MYKVKNKMGDVRKFWDRYLGKEVFVEPGKSVVVNRPPEENNVWKVTSLEEKEKKEPKGLNPKKNEMEVKKNDSSRNL